MKRTNRISEITIAYENGFKGNLLSRDRETALRDLKRRSQFQPVNDEAGPYKLHLSVQQNRLVFEIENNEGKKLKALGLSLRVYSRLIRDYFMIVQSYDDAMREGLTSRIEAIDMGRRGLHNEGAGLLMERLKDKIVMDLDTARRLFTLICVLHSGKMLSLH